MLRYLLRYYFTGGLDCSVSNLMWNWNNTYLCFFSYSVLKKIMQSGVWDARNTNRKLVYKKKALFWSLCPSVPRLALLSADVISQLRNGPQGGGCWASGWVQRCNGQNPSGCQNRRLRLKCFERHLHISVIYIIFLTARILFFFMICISFWLSDFPPH